MRGALLIPSSRGVAADSVSIGTGCATLLWALSSRLDDLSGGLECVDKETVGVGEALLLIFSLVMAADGFADPKSPDTCRITGCTGFFSSCPES